MHAEEFENRHGPISGPVNATLAAVFAALLGGYLQAPWWTTLIPALAAAVATMLLGRRRRSAVATVVYRMCCWLAAGAWTAWTIAAGWSVVGVVVLGSVALVAGMLAPAFADDPPTQARESVAQGQPLEEGLRTKLALEWKARIARVCKVDGVVIVGIEDWPLKTGYTIDLELPEGSGSSWESLAACERQLAAAAKLPPGCSVRASVGLHQGAALLRVNTVNKLADELPYPAEYKPKSILNERQIGQYIDGEPTMIELRQSAGVIAGQRGGGKTTLLQDITAELAQCTDNVVIHIDLNGGGLSVPWLYPWAQGMVDEPVPFWVAPTPAEAILVADWLLAVAKDRKTAYARLKVERNVSLLPISPQLPAYTVLVDESAEIMGDNSQAWKARQKLEELQRIGRDSAVNVVFSCLRATGDTISPAVKKQASLRIVTRVEDDEEIAYLLGWSRGLRSTDLMYPGCAYIRRHPQEPRQFKAFNILPDQIIAVSTASQQWRAKPDARAISIGGEILTKRWERTAPMLRALGLDIDGPDEPPAELATVAAAPVRPLRTREEPVSVAAALERLARTRAALEQAAAAGDLQIRDQEWYDERFEPIAATFTSPEPQEPRQDRMVAIIDAAGPEGMRSSEIGEALSKAGIKVTRQTRQEWLREKVNASELVQPHGQGRYVTARHIAEDSQTDDSE